MSDTPLTDEEERLIYSEGNYGMGREYAEAVVDADFARRIERERAALLEAIKCVLGSSEYEAHSIAKETLIELGEWQ